MRTNKLSVFGHVGAFKRFSNNDQRRTMVALDWLLAQGIELEKSIYDIVNLRYGRDFLTETLKYDFVIVHAVFRDYVPVEILSTKTKDARVSSDHSLPNWINRLVSTQAAVIFLFSDQANSLGGGHIGNLLGYQRRESPEIDLTIYQRLKAPVA